MMDIRPLTSAPDPLSSLSSVEPSSLRSNSYHSNPFGVLSCPSNEAFLHAPPSPLVSFPHPPLTSSSSSSNMVVDTPSSHHIANSSMPVSPKQGETITADSLGKQDPSKIVSSSTTSSSSWTSAANPASPSSAYGQGHMTTVKDAIEAAEKFQASERQESELPCEPWRSSKHQASAPSSKPQLSSETSKEVAMLESGAVNAELSSSDMSIRNGDSQDASASPQSQVHSGFEDSSIHGLSGNNMQATTGPFLSAGTPSNLDASFERRSRRKPTIEDIVRRVRPVEDEPYDSEESEIEDDILNDEMLRRMKAAEDDEVDGSAKESMRILDYVGEEEEERYRDQYKQFKLSRHEGTDGMPDEEELADRSEDGSLDTDKNAFLKDVPQHIYDLMHEVKVNAHAMFTKTANNLSPAEAKMRREQYLLQLLSNLRDRCLDDGLRPEVIAAILKDVEMEVTLMHEDLEDLKRYNIPENDSVFPQDQLHFLSKPPEIKREVDSPPKEGESKGVRHDSFMPSANPPSFLTGLADSPISRPPPRPMSSMPSSVAPATPKQSLPTPPSSMSTPKADIKPTIITVSANIPNPGMNGDLKPPPPLIPNGPNLHPLGSNENGFSPNLFGNGKMGSWFPGGLPNMPLYPFSPGSPLDHALARRFLHEGKIGDNVDKDYLKCQFCERTFRRQKNLENHIENTHQGKGQLKPRRETTDMYFKCSHCPYTTKHQSNLYVHLRIHTGERPYICGACGVQYSQSHSLKSHIINKHDGIMSYYIKEKRTRSPRGMGYLTTQVMQDNSIFKLPPPPLLGPGMGPNNLDLVTKAIEMAKSEHAQHQHQLQQQQQQQHLSPKMHDSPRSHQSMTPNNGCNGGSNSSGPTSHLQNGPSSLPSSMPKSPSSSSSGHSTPSSTPSSMIPSSGGPHGIPHPPPPFFMNGPHMSPLMFGELPHHIRNPGHMGPGPGGHPAPHLFPGFHPFSPHSGLSPLSGLSPNSSANLPSQSPHHNSLPQHLQMPSSMAHPMHTPPLPGVLPHTIKKEPTPPSAPSTPSVVLGVKRPRSESPARSPAGSGTAKDNNNSSRTPTGDEAMDLRKKSPPLGQHAHDLSTCGGKENCNHAAKLKYLRLNVVRMLGILVPNLNFAEKGISAESESVDELLQDVIESNTHDDDVME